MHKSRMCYVTIDVNDLEEGVKFWLAALAAKLEPFATTGNSDQIYRRLVLPDTNIRMLLQLVSEKKTCKSRAHIDIESDDVDAEAGRLEALGAKRQRLVDERGFRFWVMEDPFGNEFCVIQPEYPDLLSQRPVWD